MSIGIANGLYNSEFASGITNPAYITLDMNGYEITGLPSNPALLTSSSDAISVGATIQRLGTYSARNMYVVDSDDVFPSITFNPTGNKLVNPTFTIEPIPLNTTEPVGTPHSLIYLYPNYDNNILTAVYPRQTLTITGRCRMSSGIITSNEISIDAVPFLYRQTGLPPYTRLNTYSTISHTMTQAYQDSSDGHWYLPINIRINLPQDQVAYTTIGLANVFKSLGVDIWIYGQGATGVQLTPQATDKVCIDFEYIASPFLYT